MRLLADLGTVALMASPLVGYLAGSLAVTGWLEWLRGSQSPADAPGVPE